MKKIVFVEKEEGSYDPVANYFNKKNNTNKTVQGSNTNSNFKQTNNTGKKAMSAIKPPIDKTGPKKV